MKKFFFSFEGRMNRKEYFKGWISCIGILIILALGLRFLIGGENAVENESPLLSVLLLQTVGAICVYSMAIRRFHDLGKSGWFSLLFIVPIVGFFTWIYLFFAKGEEEENPYGSPSNSSQFSSEMDIASAGHK